MKEIKTTNFFNDVLRVLKYMEKGSKKKNNKVAKFFSKMFEEMKRE